MKQFNENGEPIRGDRIINSAEAEVIRRIFATMSLASRQSASLLTK